MTDLIQRQVELEADMQGLGAQVFRERVARSQERGEESVTVYGLDLTRKAIDPVARAIQGWLDEMSVTRRGPRAVAVTYLQGFDPNVVAFITLKTVIDQISKHRSLTRVAMRVADGLEDEARFTAFEEQKGSLFSTVRDYVQKSSNAGYRAKVLTYAANRYGVEFQGWPEADKLQVGTQCLHLLAISTGYIEITNERRRNRRALKVHATEKLLDWINSKLGRCELLSPMRLPMIAPPLPWATPTEGGYYSSAVQRRSFMKASKDHMALVEEHWDRMSTVVDAVNIISRTGWRVNERVYTTAREAWELGHQIGKLPNRENLSRPPCPLCGQHVGNQSHPCFEEDDQLKILWKREAHRIHEKNARARAKRIQASKILWIAEKFLSEETIYFPHQIDFRGRLYPEPMFLQPQGNDLAKALLTFAKGKPINDGVAAGWLMVHGAGCFGFDKVGLEERIAWVQEHEKRILAIANDPWRDQWWTEADKPWQFLAFCFEWAAFQAHGWGYVSRLPVSMDGSCNGLQHFSAMLRDPIGGKATNLTPAERPADIYQEVADVVTAKLQGILSTSPSNDNEGDSRDERSLAEDWLQFGVTRKTTKRPVMVVPYSGTRFSCRQYIQEYIEETIEERLQANPDYEPPWDTHNLFKPSNFLAGLVWDAISEVVVAAREAMSWLQKVARAACKEGKSLSWITPAGLPVLQAYYDTREYRVKIKVGDQLLRPSLRVFTLDLKASDQANGISPNLVHSLDGAALQITVCELYEQEGVEEFAMVHDSYGCPAGDAELLARYLREVFVWMYEEHDVLEMFREKVQATLGEAQELPPVPPKGSLDLAAVRSSDFFFA